MFDDIKNMFHHLKVYMLGKGILTLAVFATVGIASTMGLGFSVLLPALVVGVGGTLLTAADRLYRQSLYQDDMVELYRDNIADQLGIQPGQVTKAHLKEAAKSNDVMAQALKRQSQRTMLEIGTAALSGAVSIGLIAAFGLDKDTIQGIAEKSLWEVFKPLAVLAGVGTVAGATGLLLHDGLGAAIGHGTGISKAAAHDLIIKMDGMVKRGKPISREEVYAVVVAANPELDKRITTLYGKHFTSLSRAQQQGVLHDVGLAETVDLLAQSISKREIRAGFIAYAVTDPRLTRLPEKVSPVDEQRAPEPEPQRGKFVENLGLAPRSGITSHTARIAQERAGASPDLVSAR